MSKKYRLNSQADIHWLIRLRWIAIAGQIATILLAMNLLHVKLNSLPLYLLVLTATISNLALSALHSKGKAFSSNSIGRVLLLDTVLLASLLYFSGGSANPFSTLFLVHITLAAVVIGPFWTWILGAFSTICFLALFFFYVPVPMLNEHHSSHGGHEFSLHLQGMLVAFVITAALITYFLEKVTKQISWFEKQRLLQAKMTSLATLAAGAAHELGSPLGSISIASGEMSSAIANGDTDLAYLAENVRVIERSVGRCKNILESMSSRFADAGTRKLLTYKEVKDILAQLRSSLDEIDQKRFSLEQAEPLPPIQLDPQMLITALREMLTNAFHASKPSDKIEMRVLVSDQHMVFEVEDEGEGISEENVVRAKEPFFTTKEPGAGMGLGFFIVDLLAQSMAGRFEIISTLGQGTTASLSVPLAPTPGK